MIIQYPHHDQFKITKSLNTLANQIWIVTERVKVLIESPYITQRPIALGPLIYPVLTKHFTTDSMVINVKKMKAANINGLSDHEIIIKLWNIGSIDHLPIEYCFRKEWESIDNICRYKGYEVRHSEIKAIIQHQL